MPEKLGLDPDENMDPEKDKEKTRGDSSDQAAEEDGVASGKHEYAPAEIAKEVEDFFERMKADTERQRTQEILNKLLENLSPEEQEVLKGRMRGVFKRMRDKGYSLETCFMRIGEALGRVLEASEERAKE